MANWSDLYFKVEVTNKRRFKKFWKKNDMWSNPISVDTLEFKGNVATIHGDGRWGVGIEAIEDLPFVVEVLEYYESEGGCDFYNDLTGEYDYFSEPMILNYGVEYAIDNYEQCFESKEDCLEEIALVEKVNNMLYPDDPLEEDWWKVWII